MTYKIFVYLSLFAISCYAAERPERNRFWADPIQTRIAETTDELNDAYRIKSNIYKQLLKRGIKAESAQGGSITIQPAKIADHPGFKIGTIEEIPNAVAQSIEADPSLSSHARAISSLVETFFHNSQAILILNMEIDELNQSYKKYKKPALRHPTT